MSKYITNSNQRILTNTIKYEQIKKNISKIYEQFGSIDILINNIGHRQDDIILNMSEKNWTDIIKINLTYTFLITKSVIKYMMQKRYGRIVSIGSIIGNIGNIGQANYSASKYGIIGFNKTLALETAKYGITANVISPGFIKTNMTKFLTSKIKNMYIKKIPINRFGTVQDITNAVVFLISSKSSYITGQSIHVNGGMYMY